MHAAASARKTTSCRSSSTPCGWERRTVCTAVLEHLHAFTDIYTILASILKSNTSITRRGRRSCVRPPGCGVAPLSSPRNINTGQLQQQQQQHIQTHASASLVHTIYTLISSTTPTLTELVESVALRETPKAMRGESDQWKRPESDQSTRHEH